MIDIIIATYKGYSQLSKSVTHIASNSHLPYQLIIVDNNSSPDQDEILKIKSIAKKHALSLQYICSPNIGLSNARNLGIQHVKSAYFAFIDQDEYIHRDWVKTLISWMKKHPNVDVVTGPKKGTKPNNYWNYVWYSLYKFGKQYEGIIDFATSSNSCYKTEFVKKHKIFFDPQFRSSSEDFVYSFLLRKKHAKMYFSTDIWLHHDFRDSFSSFFKQWLGYGESMYLYHQKYHSITTKHPKVLFINFMNSLQTQVSNIWVVPGIFILNLAYTIGYIKAVLARR